MRVLLDENLPHDLIDAFASHTVSTVHGHGWAGIRNGALLKRASGVIDVFVTMDRNLEHQQKVSALSFGIVVVSAPSNRMQDLAPLIPEIVEALARVRPPLSSTLAASGSARTAQQALETRTRAFRRNKSFW